MDSEDRPDRRKWRRHDKRDRLFVALRPDFEVVGKLCNISAGGMAFDYNAFQSCSKDGKVLVDVFSHPGDIIISKASCRVVHDARVECAVKSPDYHTRRCGVEFRDLTAHQRWQVSLLLDGRTPEFHLNSESCFPETPPSVTPEGDLLSK